MRKIPNMRRVHVAREMKSLVLFISIVGTLKYKNITNIPRIKKFLSEMKLPLLMQINFLRNTTPDITVKDRRKISSTWSVVVIVFR